ncbi:hypothetical protein AMECASPLE_018063 [Ameca splendens]|uniref:Uncharacterized protein n=1 Tax=Ameca splendens TaxID=208324 RepID=A0ABV0XRK8_9TELE
MRLNTVYFFCFCLRAIPHNEHNIVSLVSATSIESTYIKAIQNMFKVKLTDDVDFASGTCIPPSNTTLGNCSGVPYQNHHWLQESNTPPNRWTLFFMPTKSQPVLVLI